MARRVFAGRAFKPRVFEPAALRGVGNLVISPVTQGGMVIGITSHDKPTYKSGFSSWSNPLWDGMLNAWCPSLGATGNVVRNVAGVDDLSNNASWKPGYLEFNGSDQLAGGLDNLSSPASEPLTMHTVCRVQAGVAPGEGEVVIPLSIADPSVTLERVMLWMGVVGGVTKIYYTVSTEQAPNNFTETVESSERYTTWGEWVSITGVSEPDFSGGWRYRHIYVNGELRGSSLRLLSTLSSKCTSALLGGLYWDTPKPNTAIHTACDVSHAYHWNRALSHDEIQLLHQDPDAPFRSVRRIPTQNIGPYARQAGNYIRPRLGSFSRLTKLPIQE